MATIYRQYRPSTFQEIVGQNHVTKTLQAAITKNRLAHAYLFHGPRGTGKTTIARLLAKRVNCHTSAGPEACGQCQSCQAFTANNNIDIIEIDAASNRKIDDIRALREKIVSVPNFGRYKVYIIDEVHMLVPEASAALLKTLEEPVQHVIFILATTELHKVLPTILSRCQVFRFRRATRQELSTRLNYLLKQEKRSADQDVIEYIINHSDGCFRDAESLLGQLLTLQQKKLKMDALANSLGLPPANLIERFNQALFQDDSANAVNIADEALSAGHDPEQLIKESVLYARDQALQHISQDKPGSDKWSRIIRALLQALQDLAYVPQPTIALHLAILTVHTSRERSIRPSASTSPTQSNQLSTNRNLSPNHDHASNPSSLPPHPKPIQKQNQSNRQTTPNHNPSNELSQIKKSWPLLIKKIKDKNPVAAAFLRAIEPIAINDNTLTVRARYALHKNFFANPNNSKLITSSLQQIIKQPVSVNFILDENSRPQTSLPSTSPGSKQDQFYSMVKEIFS